MFQWLAMTSVSWLRRGGGGIGVVKDGHLCLSHQGVQCIYSIP